MAKSTPDQCDRATDPIPEQELSHGNWIKLHRKLLDSAVASDPWLMFLWIHLLLRANWKPSWFAGVAIKIGQVAFSQVKFAEYLGVKRSKLIRGLNKLKKLGQITQKSNSRFTVVTICNWETYQNTVDPGRTTNEQPADSERTANDTHPKKLRTKETSPKSPPSSTVDPSSWEGAEAALEQRGVAAACNAVDAAKARGLAPSDVLKLIVEYDAAGDALGAGALHRRVSGSLSAWPPPSEKHVKEQQRRAASNRAAETAARNRAAHRRSLAERSQAEQDEKNFGPSIDAMKASERSELLQAAVPDPDARRLMGKNMRRAAMVAHLKASNKKAMPA